MATIPRTYLTTSKTGLSSIPLRNGQVISIWDNDEVWYDAPANGERDGQPIRRKISGIRIVSTLPANPMTDIVYVYIGDHGTLPETGEPLYDLRVWVNDEWLVVGNNWEDSFVKSVVSNDKFYLVGTPNIDETVGSLLKNSSVYVQNGELYGNLRGNADTATEANHAAQATLSDRAINDNASTPKPITGYLNDVVSDATSGTTITFTKGDGTTKTIKAANTTYGIYDADNPGLVNGTNTQVLTDTSGLILSGDGWIDGNNITMPNADKADKDSSGQVIDSTYVASASYNTSDQELTLTYGDGTSSSPISIPNTTYGVFTLSADGLVPAASGTGEGNMFLRGDATWQPITINPYQGATSIDDGVDGLVPHAIAGEQDYYLKGDGTWGTTFAEGVDGLVPGPSLSDVGKSLKVDASGNGVWDFCDDTLNTTGASNDTVNSLYLVGSTLQNPSNVTNTNQYVFIQGSRLYQSDGGSTPSSVAVVDVSSTQALTNKTYEGYTLGTACASTVASTIDATVGTQLPTCNAIITYTTNRLSIIQTLLTEKTDIEAVAPVYDNTQTYKVGTYCMYDDNNGARLYRCITAVSVAEDFDSTKWQKLTISDCLGFELTDTLAIGSTSMTLTDNRITVNDMVDVYTDTYGVNPSNVVVTAGQIVLTFPAQATAVNVKVVIRR